VSYRDLRTSLAKGRGRLTWARLQRGLSSCTLTPRSRRRGLKPSQGFREVKTQDRGLTARVLAELTVFARRLSQKNPYRRPLEAPGFMIIPVESSRRRRAPIKLTLSRSTIQSTKRTRFSVANIARLFVTVGILRGFGTLHLTIFGDALIKEVPFRLCVSLASRRNWREARLTHKRKGTSLKKSLSACA